MDNTTAITVNSAWTSPGSNDDTRNVDTLINHMLNSAFTIPSLQSSDSGRYSCSFSVNSSSAYVTTSDQVSASTTIQAGTHKLYNCMDKLLHY